MPPQIGIGLASQFLGNMAGGAFGKVRNPYQADISRQRGANQMMTNMAQQNYLKNNTLANKSQDQTERLRQNAIEGAMNPDATNSMLRSAGAQMGNITANAAQAQGRYNAQGNALNMGGGVTGGMMQDNFYNNPISQAMSQGAVQYAMGADERRNRALGLADQGYQSAANASRGFFGDTMSGINNLTGQYQAEGQAAMERDAALQGKRDQISGMFGNLGGQYLNQMNSDRDFKSQDAVRQAEADYYRRRTS